MIKNKNILVYGANSDLSFELLKSLSSENNLFLVSKNREKLEETKNKLSEIKPNKIINYCADLNDLKNCYESIDVALKEFDHLDYIFFYQGYMNEEDFDHDEIIKTLNINALSTLIIINHVLKKIDKLKKLKIVVISSVAGDRGKSSTLLYGSTKSFLSTYLEGLIQKYSETNVKFYDIKPGPIKTKMTKNLKQNFLYSTPQSVSKKIYKLVQNKNSTISYIPFWWRYIMTVIKIIPDFIFHKLKL